MEVNHGHLLQAPKAAFGYEDNAERVRGRREGRVQVQGGGLRTTMYTVASVGEGLKRRASGMPEKPRRGALHDPLGHDDDDAFRELDECFHDADGLMPRVSREEDLVYLGGKGDPALFALHHQGQAGMSPPLHESGDLNVSGSEGEKLSNRGVFLTGKEGAKLRAREPRAGDTVSRGETGGDIHRTESASSDQTSGCDSHASSISTGATALSKKRPWKPEEDEYLRALVHRQGARDWSQIAEHFENRNGKQCHQRWNYFLSPTVHSGAWTAEEDEKIVHYQCLLGNKWARIATHIPGRTGHAVKNRAHQIANKIRKCERKRARSQGWAEGEGGTEGRGKKTGPSHAPPAVDRARSTRRAQGYPNPNPDLVPGPMAGALAQGGEEDSVTEACSGIDSGGGTTCSTTSSSSSSAVAAPGHAPGSGHNHHHHHHHHHHHNLRPEDVAETAGPLGMSKARSGGVQGAGKTKIPPETHCRGGSSAFISASLGPPVASTEPKRASPPSREELVPALDTAGESLPGESPCAATALSSTALSLAVPLTVGGVQHFLTAQRALAQHRGEEGQWADGTAVPPILYHEGVAYVPVATTTLPSPCGPPPSASSVKAPTVGKAGPMRAWEAAKKNVICLERLTEHQALMQHHLRLQQQRLTMERRREEAVVNEACGLVDLDGLPVADHDQESAGSGGARNIIHHHHHDEEQQEQEEDEEAEAEAEAEVGDLDLLHRHYHHHHHHHHPAGGGDEEEEDLAIVPPTFEEDGL